ncbi:MAG: hypothetical protein M3141_08800 [Actinomycetota bacterium]|nr:hypothetical protein [Actinomycetota bacterium]
MTERSEQLDRLREAVDRKSAEAQERSRAGAEHPPAGDDLSPESQNLTGTDRTQDASSVRDKNAGKGKKTADKWNQ